MPRWCIKEGEQQERTLSSSRRSPKQGPCRAPSYACSGLPLTAPTMHSTELPELYMDEAGDTSSRLERRDEPPAQRWRICIRRHEDRRFPQRTRTRPVDEKTTGRGTYKLRGAGHTRYRDSTAKLRSTQTDGAGDIQDTTAMLQVQMRWGKGTEHEAKPPASAVIGRPRSGTP